MASTAKAHIDSKMRYQRGLIEAVVLRGSFHAGTELSLGLSAKDQRCTCAGITNATSRN